MWVWVWVLGEEEKEKKKMKLSRAQILNNYKMISTYLCVRDRVRKSQEHNRKKTKEKIRKMKKINYNTEHRKEETSSI